MSDGLVLRFTRRPSALGNMTRALLPSPGLRRVPRVPPMAARWAPHAAGHWQVDAFHALTGLPRGADLPLLYLHVLNFPLQFALLTHPVFPVPIWGVLQVRNHLVLHAPVRPADTITQEVRVAGQRTGDKATEVDLYSRILRGEEVVYEALNTYWTRQRAGAPDAPSPLQQAPTVDGAVVAEWRAPAAGGLSFARLSGDYNGVHYAHWYARRLGFAGAFLHPQRMLGACAAHLAAAAGPSPAEPQRLDAWIRGPVRYGTAVTLRLSGASSGPSGCAAGGFALHVEDDPRPALLGRVHRHTPGKALLDAAGAPLPP